MLVLRTLGECVIEVGGQRFGPGAPHVFGALLYLGMERGRIVPRATLQTLLFPEASETNGSHSLRQLLYRIRQIGAPLESSVDGVSCPLDGARDDYSALFAPAPEERDDLRRVAGGFLPGYHPRWSRPFAEWVDEQRAFVHARIRRTLLAELAEHRRGGRWEAVERIARTVLAIDSLNEEATLGLAEALAVGGSKVQAVRLLDQYIAEAGPGVDGVRLPATLLRRRIAERLPAIEYDASRAPFVGRAEEMAELHALLTRARAGDSRAAIVWGDAGIGKTRLVAEFCKAAVLGGATVLRSVSQPHDVRRPMGAFLDLAPGLLRLPGALGTSPESMKYLQRLVSFDPQLDQPLTAEMRDPEYLSACITRALSELLDAVSAESPLILVIEDAQWLDRVSGLVLADLLAERRERRLLLVCTWRAGEDPTGGTPFPDRTRAIRLSGLSASDAERLIEGQLRQLAVPPEPSLTEWGVRTAQGNPFFLHEIARHYAVHREVGDVPTSLLDLLRARIAAVSADARRLLAAGATLGALATLERLDAVLRLRRSAFHDALAQLEEHGLVDCSGEVVTITHPLLGELVLQRTTPGVKRMLHRHAAEVLDQELEEGVSILILSCVEHWYDAGRGDRAASRLRRCSEHAARLGQYDEALSLLKRALEQAREDELRAYIGLDVLTLAEGANDSTQVLQLTRELLATLPDIVLGTELRDRLQLSQLRARWRTGEEPSSLLSDVMRLLESPSALVRLNALALCLILLDYDCDSARAHQLYSDARTFLDSLPPTERASSKVDLIYHTSFGNSEHALSIALKGQDSDQSSLAAPGAIQSLLTCAIACTRCGAYAAALSMFRDCYAAGKAQGLHGQTFLAATQATASALDSGDFATARQWHAAAIEAAKRSNARHALPLHSINDLRLSIAEGRMSDARAAAARIHDFFPTSPTSKYRAIARSLSVVILLLEGASATEQEVAQLEIDARQALGDHSLDLVIATYCDVLNRADRCKEASDLASVHLAGRSTTQPFLGSAVSIFRLQATG